MGQALPVFAIRRMGVQAERAAGQFGEDDAGEGDGVIATAHELPRGRRADPVVAGVAPIGLAL